MRILSNIQKIQELIKSRENFLVAFGKDSSFDHTAAALSVFLALSKLGKNVTVVSPKEPLVEDASLVGIDKITKELGGGKLVISLEDALGSVEKVTHFLEGEKLNIVIHPLSGSPPFTKEKVGFSHSAPQFDVIFLVGVEELSDMDNLYTQNNKIYSEGTVVYIGKVPSKFDLKQIDIIDATSSCFSETIALLLSQLEIGIDQDISSNLFLGIRASTASFSTPPATADTFEVATILLKHGPQTQVRETRKDTVFQTQDIPSEVKPQEEPQPDWLTPKIFKSSKNP